MNVLLKSIFIYYLLKEVIKLMLMIIKQARC